MHKREEKGEIFQKGEENFLKKKKKMIALSLLPATKSYKVV